MIERFARSLLIAVALGTFTQSGNAHEPTAFLENVNDNTWVLVSGGGVTAYPGILSYSGGWYDPVHHQFCLFGLYRRHVFKQVLPY